MTAAAVSLDCGDALALRQLAQALVIDVDDGQLVLAVKRLDDGRPDLPCADYEDLHCRAKGIVRAGLMRLLLVWLSLAGMAGRSKVRPA